MNFARIGSDITAALIDAAHIFVDGYKFTAESKGLSKILYGNNLDDGGLEVLLKLVYKKWYFKLPIKSNM